MTVLGNVTCTRLLHLLCQLSRNTPLPGICMVPTVPKSALQRGLPSSSPSLHPLHPAVSLLPVLITNYFILICWIIFCSLLLEVRNRYVSMSLCSLFTGQFFTWTAWSGLLLEFPLTSSDWQAWLFLIQSFVTFSCLRKMPYQHRLCLILPSHVALDIFS